MDMSKVVLTVELWAYYLEMFQAARWGDNSVESMEHQLATFQALWSVGELETYSAAQQASSMEIFQVVEMVDLMAENQASQMVSARVENWAVLQAFDLVDLKAFSSVGMKVETMEF